MNIEFCKYKNILGEPNKGFHSIRVFDFAVLDIIGTLLIAYLIAKRFKINFYKVAFILFGIGVFMHWLFCVETKFNRFLANLF